MAAAPKEQVGDGIVETREFQTISADPNESTTVPIWQSIKSNPKAIAYSICLTIGPLMYGFDNIIIGVVTALPAFQKSFGEVHGSRLIIPALWLSLWNAFLQVGAMIGSAINGPIADRIGRRFTFVIGGIVGIVAVTVIYVSDLSDDVNKRRGTFLAGKIILGITLGILNSTCQTYISEVSPPRLRGPLLSAFTFTLILGQLIAISLVFARIDIPTPSSYRVCFASQWALTGFAVIAGFLVPESPTHLVRKGDADGARKAFARLYHPETTMAGIAAIETAIAKEIEENNSSQESNYRDCFRGSDWRRTRIVIYANVLQQCLGVTLLANGAYFLQLGGMSPTQSLLITEIAIGIGLPANMVSWFTMTKFGRRFIILASTSVVGVIWLAVGIAGCFPGSSAALWFIGIAIIVIGFCYNLGVGGAYPVVGAESSSIRLRAYTQGIGFILNGFASWAFNFFVPYMFDADQANLGGKMGFFFAGLCLIGVVVVWFEIPEMKNRTYQELDEMFAEKLPTRKFKTHVCSGVNTVLTKTEMGQ